MNLNRTENIGSAREQKLLGTSGIELVLASDDVLYPHVIAESGPTRSRSCRAGVRRELGGANSEDHAASIGRHTPYHNNM